MSIADIIGQISNNESIAVRLCTEAEDIKYVITRQNNITPRQYKLYKIEKNSLIFTGKSELSPLDLETSVVY